jgi:hypothetical protein
VLEIFLRKECFSELSELAPSSTTQNAFPENLLRCKEHRIYPLILRSYRLELQCLYHHTQAHASHILCALCLSPHTCPSFVLADLLVSHLNCYGSVHFGSECASYT